MKRSRKNVIQQEVTHRASLGDLSVDHGAEEERPEEVEHADHGDDGVVEVEGGVGGRVADLGQRAVGEGQTHADEHVATRVDPHHQEPGGLDAEEHGEAAADLQQFGALKR